MIFLNIVVLAGGLSPERNVSLTSGSLIASALRKRGHRVALVDVYEGIKDPASISEASFIGGNDLTPTVSREVPDLEALIEKNGGRCQPVGEGVVELCRLADVTFLALHGATGENGQLQALLDIEGIKYTGSGYIGSLLAMDKDVAKKMLRYNGVLTPDWERFDAEAPMPLDTIIERIGFPCVVKPCSCGSSVGVSLVDNAEQLESAIELAKKYERFMLIEKRIIGRELSQGYVDGKVLPPVEIIPKSGFYDYENKYQAGATEELCPAPLTDEELSTVSEATRKGFEALRLEGYARIDFILDAEGRAWCLEANTLPGMTPTSLLPQEAAAIGIEYAELCEKLAMLALKK